MFYIRFDTSGLKNCIWSKKQNKTEKKNRISGGKKPFIISFTLEMFTLLLVIHEQLYLSKSLYEFEQNTTLFPADRSRCERSLPGSDRSFIRAEKCFAQQPKGCNYPEASAELRRMNFKTREKDGGWCGGETVNVTKKTEKLRGKNN